MNCEVQHIDKNIRYRILIINGEHYILDMERSFLSIIFPFLFWMFPSTVFKVEDLNIVEQLKEPKREKVDSSWLTFLGGLAYVLGILLTPLMDYFNIPSSILVNTIMLVFVLILVALLYLSISSNRKRKLNNIVKLEELQKNLLRIRPSSIKQIFKVLVVYTWFLGLSLLGFVAYIQTGNIMVLIIGSGLFFILLLVSRITVEEGHTTVRFKDYEKVI
ncbi:MULTISPECIES: DUF443 family protein [Oceanobacillus]|uniref:DUF443 family protein n=1 Tax=Oceanobacillus TaxID=182709 RepID=UPI000984B31D|nr:MULTISPECIES: DUF443 family protein [Oceanobacillus]MBT2598931.1 DUF443 family protein [Oceanobacillus sp. ISL-74]MBT2651850.1 DUF443 family protein [Oceanobacillus sp. ISL-73]